jgi:hypothetical protein
MLISTRKSKQSLAILWFTCSGIVFVIVIIQSFLGYYGANLTDAWGWLLPTIVPTQSLIIGVLVSDALGRGRKPEYVDQIIFNIAFGLSAMYLLTVIGQILFQPFSPTSPIELMKQSHLWLGPFQGLVSASLGAFFINKQRDEESTKENHK